MRDVPDLSHLAQPGAMLVLRVTPKARRNAVTLGDADSLRVHVTAAPENGKANAAVIRLLSRALNVPKSRLEIARGASGRDKLLRILA